jgi:hypothetical protein
LTQPPGLPEQDECFQHYREHEKAKRWRETYQGRHRARPICPHCSEPPCKAVYLVAVYYRRNVEWPKKKLVKAGYVCRHCSYFEPL